ncbi:terminase small subunit [Methylobacterium sp. WL9]|uniref:terminase small subunit n=1 Tax=Methylobacterium sp. WL9 TaxID=2603898 RepID=UPI0011C7F37E|nr:terminase small subunit [Methylobacterium sp. WL9]TXN21275.1 hypothetical protein FV217_14865 [Methylobacterium sp. WL9]
MPTKSGTLGPQERVFVERYAATGDATYAAEKAGYAQPRQRASQNLAKPGIQLAVSRDVTNRLDRMAPKLLGRLENLIDDPDTPAKQLIDMSKTLLPFWKASQTGAETKELHEMSAAELSAFMLATKARIAELEAEARTIDHDEGDGETFGNDHARSEGAAGAGIFG